MIMEREFIFSARFSATVFAFAFEMDHAKGL